MDDLSIKHEVVINSGNRMECKVDNSEELIPYNDKMDLCQNHRTVIHNSSEINYWPTSKPLVKINVGRKDEMYSKPATRFGNVY